LEEEHETAALFLSFANGATAWYSVEGGVFGISLHDKDVKKEDFLTRLLQQYKVSANQKVSITHLHNHPLKSAIAAGMTQGDKATTISVPPSGIGFSQYGGDAGYWTLEEYENAANVAGERLSISVAWNDRVVDPQGIWTYEKIPTAELAAFDKDESFYDEYLEEQALKAQSDALDWEKNPQNLAQVLKLNSTRFEKMKEMRKTADAVSALKGAWSTQSRYMPATEAVREGFYSALVDGYKKFGIKLTFEPFPIENK